MTLSSSDEVKYIPNWFPGAGFKRLAEEASRKNATYMKLPYDLVNRQLVSFIVRFLIVGMIECCKSEKRNRSEILGG